MPGSDGNQRVLIVMTTGRQTEPLANRFLGAIAVHSSAIVVYDNFARLRSLNYLGLRSTTLLHGLFS